MGDFSGTNMRDTDGKVIRRVVVPADISTGTKVTLTWAQLGLTKEDWLGGFARVVTYVDSSKDAKAFTGGSVTINATGLQIDEPTAGFAAADVATVEFYQNVETETGTGS
jgi:hypothetical protein